MKRSREVRGNGGPDGGPPAGRAAIRPARGFSLVELLIVVAIIGILTNIAIPLMRKARYRAMATAVFADFRTVERAVLLYAADTSKYPKDNYPGGTPPELVPYMKGGFPWSGRWNGMISYDFDNWIRPDGTPMYPRCGIAIGISIQTKDQVLLAEINKIVKPPLVPCVSGTYTYTITPIGP